MKKVNIKIISTVQNGGVKDYSENLNTLFKKSFCKKEKKL